MQRDRIGVGIYQSCDGQASLGLRRHALLLACAAALALGCARAFAQAPFVPTPLDVVRRMLTLAQVGPGDFLIDLGSGDGRLVITAAKEYGARGLGIEHDPELVARSRELARRDGVADKVVFMAQDLFETDLSEATVVTLYLLPELNRRLRPRLLAQLRPGTRIVAHDFDLGEWPPDATEKVYSQEKYGATGGESALFLWRVPADVAGRWRWRLQIGGEALDYELTARQRFQHVDASVRVGGQSWPVEDIRLEGERLSLTVRGEVRGNEVRQVFSGRASGDRIIGSVSLNGPRLQGAADWSAERSERFARETAEAAEELRQALSARDRGAALWHPSPR